MKNQLFDNFSQWRVCFWSGVCNMSWGLFRISTCIVFGVISIFIWIIKEIERFCKRETVASVVISCVVIALCAGWTLTFVKERSARVSAEMKRDSLSYELDNMMKQYRVKVKSDSIHE